VIPNFFAAGGFMRPEWHEIETVLLDMDGTLLDLHFDNHFWQEHLPSCWGRQRGLDSRQAKELLMPRFRRMEGTLAWYCLDYWTEELGLDVFSLKSDVQHLIALRPHAEWFLKNLVQLKKQCVLVTNAHERVLQYKLDLTGLGAHFDQVISAHVYGCPKETGGFWENLQSNLQFRPETTLLIDDNLHVLQAARDFGIKHLLTIAQPDSSQPSRAETDFHAVTDFRTLFHSAVDV
jgi:5'-nucleotidase